MGFCGGNVSSQEKQAQANQAALSNQLTQQAQTIMGASSQVFNDLISAFAPIVAAGPYQEGFSLAQLSEMKSQAITQTGVAARNAMTAVKQAAAAQGGGNIPLPGGAAIGAELTTANAMAQTGAAQLTGIDLASKEQGLRNFYAAAGALAGAPGAAFGVANQAGGVASGAAAASAQTAEDITRVQNQPGWGLSLLSAASSLGGAAISKWCWIAESLYGTYDMRTIFVRSWINDVYHKTFIGKIVLFFYGLFGKQTAKLVKVSPMLQRIFRPIFDKALAKAEVFYKE